MYLASSIPLYHSLAPPTQPLGLGLGVERPDSGPDSDLGSSVQPSLGNHRLWDFSQNSHRVSSPQQPNIMFLVFHQILNDNNHHTGVVTLLRLFAFFFKKPR